MQNLLGESSANDQHLHGVGSRRGTTIHDSPLFLRRKGHKTESKHRSVADSLSVAKLPIQSTVGRRLELRIVARA